MASEDRLFDRRALATTGLERPDRTAGTGLERVRRGVYAIAGADQDAAARYRRHVLAADRTLAGPRLFSHESAAVLLGLPVLCWPREVHLLEERRSGGRSQLDIRRHCVGLERADPVWIDGVLVTSPARTVFDLALARPFVDAVVVADAALRLHPGVREQLSDIAEWYGHRRGHARLARVLAFANGLSGSPGESVSRVQIHESGFIAPMLQFEVVTGGRSEFGDFGWPEVRALGEFDGEVKYREDRYRLGGSVEDVVVREKNRENRMRRVMPRFARWDWRDLRAGRLERILVAAGVPKRVAR
ncbi:hypothetical protein QDR37_08095 [Amnibacterium sp. CER49]|uniref:hypothetical protein n=1 Tax=Amnibacterium sp. CER49 TaxID=3039161 RepID=UPI00244A6A41|nr:hypothetical protein [Amnibacterium sp. CER49]MDH2443900.1 hypothetical protein [Amnibacterium sp. CER49]